MKQGRRPGQNPARGMTLVELVIVTAIVGLLLGLAVPAYRDYVLRGHRAGAIAGLVRASACQERLRAAQGRYAPGECLPAASLYYRFEFSGPEPNLSFTVMAAPLGAQSKDRCGTLGLGHDGQRWVSASTEDPVRCWQNR